MSAARKAAGIVAQGPTVHSQWMNIDFYRIQEDAGGVTEFRNSLIQAMRSRGRNRSAVVAGERIDLYECTRRGSTIEGELGRVRMNDAPAIANEECEVSEIPMEETDGVTEKTAFLLDSDNSVLIVHSRREAVSASRIAGYCDKFIPNRAASFYLKPLLRADATARLQSMQTYKRVDVEYARGTAGLFRNADQTTRSFLNGLERLDGQSIVVGVSAGGKKASVLSYEGVQSLIRSAFGGPQERVEKFEITGRNAGDEPLFVDLLEDRLRVRSEVRFTGRAPTYAQKRDNLRAAHQANVEQIRREDPV